MTTTDPAGDVHTAWQTASAAADRLRDAIMDALGLDERPRDDDLCAALENERDRLRGEREAARESTYTPDEGERILAEVAVHPKRELIETIAEATYDLANEHGGGGGMWYHTSQAHGLVEALPALGLDAMQWELEVPTDAAPPAEPETTQQCPNCAPGYDCERGIYTPTEPTPPRRATMPDPTAAARPAESAA